MRFLWPRFKLITKTEVEFVWGARIANFLTGDDGRSARSAHEQQQPIAPNATLNNTHRRYLDADLLIQRDRTALGDSPHSSSGAFANAVSGGGARQRGLSNPLLPTHTSASNANANASPPPQIQLQQNSHDSDNILSLHDEVSDRLLTFDESRASPAEKWLKKCCHRRSRKLPMWTVLIFAGFFDSASEVLDFVAQPYLRVFTRSIITQTNLPFTAGWSWVKILDDFRWLMMRSELLNSNSI